jgi:tetratricopeptide (TPR) repeat protein
LSANLPATLSAAAETPVTLPIIRKAKSRSAATDNFLAGAIASYDEAIKLNPDRAEVYLKRGIAHRLQGALDRAIEDFDKATALDPTTTRNDRAVAEAYSNHGQIQLTNLRAGRSNY